VMVQRTLCASVELYDQEKLRHIKRCRWIDAEPVR
jgi:hypothetical protein